MLSMEPTTNNIHYLDGFLEFQGCTIRRPQTRLDYVRLCRRFLKESDYNAFIKAAFDNIHYEYANEYIKNLVDSYLSYPE